jgi:uncharacterized protein (PEP-CTERM system associated)
MAHELALRVLAAALVLYGFAPHGVVWPAEPAAPSAPSAPDTAAPDRSVVGIVRPGEWRLVPSVLLRETWTDNIDLSPGDRAQSEFVTEIAPGLAITRRGRRFQLDFDYRLNALVHVKDSDRNRVQNNLAATARLEAIENFFFVDANASIAQESISAFGTQPTSNISDVRNQTETRSLRVSPYVQGRFSDVADYRLAYTVSTTERKDAGAGDGTTRRLDGRVASQEVLRNFSWSFDFYDRRDDFQVTRDTQARLLRGILTYHVSPQLRASGHFGRESNDYNGPTEDNAIHGWGLEWAPTERTLISAQNEQRFFGRGYSYIFRHRTPRTVWNLSVVKDSTTTFDQPGSVSRASFVEQLERTFAPVGGLPDALREFLLQPNAVLGLLSTQVFVERRSEASVALLGLRNTVSFGVFQFKSDRLIGTPGSVVDDFTISERIDQLGARVSLQHRLTPLASLDLSLGTTRNTGTSRVDPDSRQNRLDLLLSSAISPGLGASLGARYVDFDGAEFASDYREKAVFGALTIRF